MHVAASCEICILSGSIGFDGVTCQLAALWAPIIEAACSILLIKYQPDVRSLTASPENKFCVVFDLNAVAIGFAENVLGAVEN